MNMKLNRRVNDVPKSEVDILKSLITYKEEEAYNKGYEDGKADSQSEIERLKHILDCYALQYGTVTEQQRVIDKAKADAASEIFAEIYEDCFDQFGYLNYEALAELKKKYPEGDPSPAPEEKYFSPQQVREMSPKEIHENYTAICKSMEQWQ